MVGMMNGATTRPGTTFRHSLIPATPHVKQRITSMALSPPVRMEPPGDSGGLNASGGGRDASLPASPDLSFGEWLREELQHRGWTQVALAERMPMDRDLMSKQSHVSKWLRNERRPSPKSCAVIAAALELPLDELLTRAGHRGVDMKMPDEGTSPVRDHLISLIAQTPEDRLQHLVPLFEWMYRESHGEAH